MAPPRMPASGFSEGYFDYDVWSATKRNGILMLVVTFTGLPKDPYILIKPVTLPKTNSKSP